MRFDVLKVVTTWTVVLCFVTLVSTAVSNVSEGLVVSIYRAETTVRFSSMTAVYHVPAVVDWYR